MQLLQRTKRLLMIFTPAILPAILGVMVLSAEPQGADSATLARYLDEERRNYLESRESGTRHSNDPSERRANAYDLGLGFIVPYRPECPSETVRLGAEPPAAFEEWCERIGPDEGIRHGWYSKWHSNGRPAEAGEYRDGLRVGVWTRWYPNGSKRVQMEFRDGLQHGRLLSWDQHGTKLGEQLYANGLVVETTN